VNKSSAGLLSSRCEFPLLNKVAGAVSIDSEEKRERKIGCEFERACEGRWICMIDGEWSRFVMGTIYDAGRLGNGLSLDFPEFLPVE
jgi:hypothetical protein